MRGRLAIALVGVLAVLTLPGSVRTAPAPPMELTKTAGPASVLVGDRITYTITVRPNVSGFTIQNVRVRDELPARVRFVSVTGASCSRSGSVVTCTYPTLPAARSFQIAVTAADPGVAENTATATAILPNPDTSTTITASDTVRTTIVEPAADLAVRKTGPDRANVGANVSYSLRATNNGPQPARGVSVRDELPDSVDVVSIASGCNRTGTTVVCSAGTLASGASQTFEIVVRPRSPGTIVNQATVTSDAPRDPTAGNNSDTLRTLVTSADLVAEKSAPAGVDVGDKITYGLAVRNAGPNAAEAIVLRDDLPDGVTVVTLDPRCTRAGQVLTCNLGTIADGAREAVSLVVRPTVAGTVTNTARVSSGTFDPADGNNSASARTVVSSADVSVSKLAPLRVTVGDEIEYRLRVRNAGPSRAVGVVLVDRLPQGLDLVSRGGCTASGLQIRCTLGTLGKGASRERRIVLRARDAGVRVNRAEVSSSTHDPRAGNNDDTTTTTVEEKSDEPQPKADVSLEKTAPAAVRVGKTFRYAIVVRNGGPDAAAAVVAHDELPGGVDVATLDSKCRREDRQVTCTLGTLAARAEVSLALVVRARAVGKLTNSAEATSTTADPQGGNNRDETTTDVNAAPRADVAVSKRGPRRARVGVSFRYTLEIRNAGPNAAQAVVARDELPAAIRLVKADAPCTASGRVVTCPLGTLKAGDKRTVALAVVPTAPGRVVNAATVETTTDDGKRSNDSDRTTTTVTRAVSPLLTLDPPLGTPGFATLAIGTGFPANTTVMLRWQPGLGVPVRVRVDANGAFRTHVLVIPHDRIGRRKLVARSQSRSRAFKPVAAKFLVVPPTVQPSAFVVRG
ncbi:MAG: hypothetical protein ACXWZ1_01785 [Gaiellaceae bacterium]